MGDDAHEGARVVVAGRSMKSHVHGNSGAKHRFARGRAAQANQSALPHHHATVGRDQMRGEAQLAPSISAYFVRGSWFLHSQSRGHLKFRRHSLAIIGLRGGQRLTGEIHRRRRSALGPS